jgi:aminoglycoside phosphotransferase (APT) family kinase protein
VNAPEPTVAAFLERAGLAAPGEKMRLTPLSGGVSSDLWRVELSDRTVCVKGALSQLRVATPWFAPVDRSHVECEWLRRFAPVCPGQIPRVLAEADSRDLFAMEYFPPALYPVWKEQLLSGHVDQQTAQAVGVLLGRLHAAGAKDPGAPSRFATGQNFVALRLDPYLHTTARAHPDLAKQLRRLAATTLAIERTVVHGDVSPKNILAGPHGPVLLDAECAWFGDPAFDLAFCLNHLLIKTIKLPSASANLITATQGLADAYGSHVDWEPRQDLMDRVIALMPALALARVDGSSPVEYLDEIERHTLRRIARGLLCNPPRDLAQLAAWWVAAADPMMTPMP